jgi:hypothetical protein
LTSLKFSQLVVSPGLKSVHRNLGLGGSRQRQPQSKQRRHAKPKVGSQHGSVGIQQDAILLELRAAALASQGRQFLGIVAKTAVDAARRQRPQISVTLETAVFNIPVDASRSEADGDIQTKGCRGMIRVYSELLVEENKRRRRQNWNPGALFDLPGWW